MFYELKHTSISNFAALVTHKISRHSYPHALLILPYNFSIFPFLLVALMVCIIIIVIRMPNNGVCPIQVVTQDADMAENINFDGQIVQNSTKFGAIVARMKQIPGTVALF